MYIGKANTFIVSGIIYNLKKKKENKEFGVKIFFVAQKYIFLDIFLDIYFYIYLDIYFWFRSYQCLEKDKLLISEVNSVNSDF